MADQAIAGFPVAHHQGPARLAEAARQKDKAKARPPEEPREAPRPVPAPVAEPPRTKAVEAENRLEPVASQGDFARQKGNLRLPVRGTVAGRFGAPREGGGTWRGLFIKAGPGDDVKAVAAKYLDIRHSVTGQLLPALDPAVGATSGGGKVAPKGGAAVGAKPDKS